MCSTRSNLIVLLGTLISLLLVFPSPAEEGTAERLGRRIDQGLEEIADEVQQTWDDVREAVDQLSVQGRVYGRLRWEKALVDVPIDVGVENQATVVLTGSVPSEQVRVKAVQLAQETVGVREIIDRLVIEPGRRTNSSSASDPYR